MRALQAFICLLVWQNRVILVLLIFLSQRHNKLVWIRVLVAICQYHAIPCVVQLLVIFVILNNFDSANISFVLYSKILTEISGA